MRSPRPRRMRAEALDRRASRTWSCSPRESLSPLYAAPATEAGVIIADAFNLGEEHVRRDI